jgi:rare lipoprotein A
MKKNFLLALVIFWLPSWAFAFEQEGVASWYGGHFHGRKTASGEVFDTYNDYTAAHQELPFGTTLMVTNLDNGKSIKVRVNDRGPFVKDRILDVSQRAAEDLGMIGTGTAHVVIKALDSNLTVEDVKAMSNHVTIQVGAYRNMLNAKKMKDRVATIFSDTQYSPYGLMTTDGVVRIEIHNVPKKETEKVLQILSSNGINASVVKSANPALIKVNS